MARERNAIGKLGKLLTLLVVVCVSHDARAQTPPSTSAPVDARKLAYVVPGLIEGITQSLAAPFQPVIRESINPSLASVNAALAAQLSNLPIPSPASGYRYVFDPSLGVYVRMVQSLGPVLAERAETLGRERFFLAVTYQRYSFDRIDDLDLRGFRIAIPVELPLGPAGPLPALVTADTLVHLTFSQVTTHFTYGLTPDIDLSYALPVVSSRIVVSTQPSLQNPATQQPLLVLPRYWADLGATGIGDGTARLKARLVRNSRLDLAVATDVRLPTGDELNYHGAGAYGVKPFVVLSRSTPRFSTHFNAGYQWNGSSFLASPAADHKEHLPSQLFYTAGFEAGMTPRITVAADFMDQRIDSAQRSFLRAFQGPDGRVYQTLDFPDQSRHEYNLSFGVKAAMPMDVVLTWNVLVRLNEAGLRARVVPLMATSVVF
jgi:Putative MetA-pathway of phenol degradation